MCLSFFSFGVLSVCFQHFDWEHQSNQKNSSAKKEITNGFDDDSNHESNRKSNGSNTRRSSEFFKHREDSLEKNFCTAPRLYKSQVKYFTKEIETKPNIHILKTFYIKYKNFVCSPRTYFVFEKVFLNFLVLLFKYY